MTIEAMQDLADRYEVRFGNLDEIAHISILTEPGFLDLLDRAVERGASLTRQDIQTVFPSVAWEE